MHHVQQIFYIRSFICCPLTLPEPKTSTCITKCKKTLFSVSSIKLQFQQLERLQQVMNVSEKHNMNFWKRCCAACDNGISFSTGKSNTLLSTNSSLGRQTENHILKHFIHSFVLVHFVSILTLCCYIHQFLSHIINSTMSWGVIPRNFSCNILFIIFIIYMFYFIYINK